MTGSVITSERVKSFAWNALAKAVASGNYDRRREAGADGVVSFTKELGQSLERDGHLDEKFGERGSVEAEIAARAVEAYDGTTPAARAYIYAARFAKDLDACGMIPDGERFRIRTPQIEAEREAQETAAKLEAERLEAERKARALEEARVRLGIGIGKED